MRVVCIRNEIVLSVRASAADGLLVFVCVGFLFASQVFFVFVFGCLFFCFSFSFA